MPNPMVWCRDVTWHHGMMLSQPAGCGRCSNTYVFFFYLWQSFATAGSSTTEESQMFTDLNSIPDGSIVILATYGQAHDCGGKCQATFSEVKNNALKPNNFGKCIFSYVWKSFMDYKIGLRRAQFKNSNFQNCILGQNQNKIRGGLLDWLWVT